MKTKNNPRYTDKKFWDQYSRGRSVRPLEHTPFADIFTKYLTPDPTKHAFEIGCAGGNYLAYLTKTFGYKASGIDFSDGIERTRKLFDLYNLPEPILYKEDLFSFHAPHLYDVVCSFGFIEHFKNLAGVVRRHADLVASSGKLIITMPHFAHCQYFLHWLIDRENLKKHNTKIMNLASVRKAFANLPFEIEYLGYYKTFGFWTERKNLKLWEKIVFVLIRKFGKAINVFFGYDKPNPLFSPHIVCVAKKI